MKLVAKDQALCWNAKRNLLLHIICSLWCQEGIKQICSIQQAVRRFCIIVVMQTHQLQFFSFCQLQMGSRWDFGQTLKSSRWICRLCCSIDGDAICHCNVQNELSWTHSKAGRLLMLTCYNLPLRHKALALCSLQAIAGQPCTSCRLVDFGWCFSFYF